MTALYIARHAGKTPAQLKDEIRLLLADNATVTAANADLECAVHKALMNTLRDAMRIAQAEAERDAAVAEVRRLQRRVIADAANLARLRQAVIQARPRYTVAVQQLDRAYVSHVQLPYRVPVGQSTANDETQQLPLVDLPQSA